MGRDGCEGSPPWRSVAVADVGGRFGSVSGSWSAGSPVNGGTLELLLEVLGEDYVRTARVKSFTERWVVYSHGLRSALTPVVTRLGIDISTLPGGAIVVLADIVVDAAYALLDPRPRLS